MRILKCFVRICVKFSVSPEEVFVYRLAGAGRGVLASAVTPQACADFAATYGWVEGIQFLIPRDFGHENIDWDRSAALATRSGAGAVLMAVKARFNHERMLLWAAALGLIDVLECGHNCMVSHTIRKNVLYAAAAFGQLAVIRKFGPGVCGYELNNIIYNSLQHGHVNIAAALGGVQNIVPVQNTSYLASRSGSISVVKYLVFEQGININDIFDQICHPDDTHCECSHIDGSYYFRCGRRIDRMRFMREVKELGVTRLNTAFGNCDDINLMRQLYEWGADNFRGAFKYMVGDLDGMKEVHGWSVKAGRADTIDYVDALRLATNEQYAFDEGIIHHAEKISLILRLGKECGVIA